MKLGTKIILSITLLLALAAFYGFAKAKRLMNVFEKITIKPVGFSNLDISLQRIRLNIDILFENPTNENFDVSGFGLVVLKSIDFYYDGVFIATAQIDLAQIDVAPNASLRVNDIPVIIPMTTAMQNLDLITNFNQNLISATAIVSIAGNQVVIDNN